MLASQELVLLTFFKFCLCCLSFSPTVTRCRQTLSHPCVTFSLPDHEPSNAYEGSNKSFSTHVTLCGNKQIDNIKPISEEPRSPGLYGLRFLFFPSSVSSTPLGTSQSPAPSVPPSAPGSLSIPPSRSGLPGASSLESHSIDSAQPENIDLGQLHQN